MSAQVDMPLESPKPTVDFDYLCKAKKTAGDAILYQAELGGLDPKQVYLSLEMQKSVWSGILSNTRSFPMRGECSEYLTFRDLCGNDAFLFWLNHKAGYDPRSLRVYRSEVEAENERLRAEVEELRREQEVIKSFLRETKQP